jgi:hypothetical protein
VTSTISFPEVERANGANGVRAEEKRYSLRMAVREEGFAFDNFYYYVKLGDRQELTKSRM